MSLFLGVAAGAAIAAPSPSSGASDIVPVIPDPLSGKEEQVTKLPNGLSVLILKDTRFPLVSTRLYVPRMKRRIRRASATCSNIWCSRARTAAPKAPSARKWNPRAAI